jgi:hypothetical protein
LSLSRASEWRMRQLRLFNSITRLFTCNTGRPYVAIGDGNKNMRCWC